MTRPYSWFWLLSSWLDSKLVGKSEVVGDGERERVGAGIVGEAERERVVAQKAGAHSESEALESIRSERSTCDDEEEMRAEDSVSKREGELQGTWGPIRVCGGKGGDNEWNKLLPSRNVLRVGSRWREGNVSV